MGAAAAAPADDTQGEGVVTDAGLLFACPECQHAFGSTRGLSLHRRRVHPTEYHAQNVPVARQKARWDHKELLILARTEIIFRRWGVRNINQRLVQITPGRTLEAIKRVRKSTRYRELLASIEQREADSSELLLEQTPSDPGEGAPDDLSNDTTPASPDSSVEWAGPVRDAIYHLGVPDGIDIDAISPGKPTIQTRAMLDSEYAWWLPPLAGPNGRPPGQRSGAPRVWTGQPVYSARARRKAAYARTQRLFQTSRQRCARNVLSSTWEVEPTPVPMALQKPYWRGIFEQESRHDDRRPLPKGPVEWSLVTPIMVEDVTRVIKGMSDGALGPDGRTLNDFKAIWREEVAAHFNVWLLAGYPPAPLRRGETVLIAKEAGAESPAKHRPITISDIILSASTRSWHHGSKQHYCGTSARRPL